MNTVSTFHISHLPVDLAVYITLYKHLKNASFLRQQLLDGNSDFEYAFIDATSVHINRLRTFLLLLNILDFVNQTFTSGDLQSRE